MKTLEDVCKEFCPQCSAKLADKVRSYYAEKMSVEEIEEEINEWVNNPLNDIGYHLCQRKLALAISSKVGEL
jgi:hypothetical protein